MGDTMDIGIHCPEDWVPLPLEPDADLPSWAARQAADLAERHAAEGEQADTDALAADLLSRSEDSRERDPVAAFGLYLSGFDTAAAILEVDIIHPDEAVPEITPAWFAEHFASDVLGEPDVQEVALPTGPAARIRQNLAGEKKSWFSGRTVIRTLMYGIRPAGFESAVTLYVSWTQAALDEPLQRTADEIAAALTVEPSRP